MKQLLYAFLLIPLLLHAQESPDRKYLEGAVPEVDGKIVFSRTLETPGLDKAHVFQRLLQWGNERFDTERSKVAYHDAEKGEIAIVGEDYLVFSNTALSLDRSLMKYRVLIACDNHSSTLRLTGIRYEYEVSYQREPEKYKAEEWITDKYALNKSKTKLTRISGKFRKATIDFAEEIFDSAAKALGATSGQAAASIPMTPLTPATRQETPAQAPEAGFVALQSDKIPETIARMLSGNAVQAHIPDGGTSDSDIAWKGIGNLLGKEICSISIVQESPVYQALGDNDRYRLYFYPTGKSADETWLIIECRKQGETPENGRATLIGEITRVWMK